MNSKYLAILLFLSSVSFAFEGELVSEYTPESQTPCLPSQFAQTNAQEISNLFNKGPDRLNQYHDTVQQEVATLDRKSEEIRQQQEALKAKSKRLADFDLIDEAKSLGAPLAIARTGIDLGLIPDPKDSELPYQFQSASPELLSLYKNLYKVNPLSAQRREAKSLGLIAAEKADQSYASGEVEEGSLYHKLAEGFLDLVVGLDPVTGIARSTYELILGKNFVTGMELSSFERSLAFVGVLSLGATNSVTRCSGSILKVANNALHLVKDQRLVEVAIERGIKLVQDAPKVAELSSALRNTPGVASISKGLSNPMKMTRGTHGNAGLVPKEVGERLVGQEFRDFSHFRKEFWKSVSESKYAAEFAPRDRLRMGSGKAPFVDESQRLGQRGFYELHHIAPLNQGGKIYDLDNIMIVTPKYHKEVLLKEFHYGR